MQNLWWYLIIPQHSEVVARYIGFTPSICPSVHPSIRTSRMPCPLCIPCSSGLSLSIFISASETASWILSFCCMISSSNHSDKYHQEIHAQRMIYRFIYYWFHCFIAPFPTKYEYYHDHVVILSMNLHMSQIPMNSVCSVTDEASGKYSFGGSFPGCPRTYHQISYIRCTKSQT